jgi:hypothetical protein
MKSLFAVGACLVAAVGATAQDLPTAEAIVAQLAQIERITDRGERLETYTDYVQELAAIFAVSLHEMGERGDSISGAAAGTPGPTPNWWTRS